MHLIALTRIAPAIGLVVEAGVVFDPAVYALSERDIAELLAIGAASVEPVPKQQPAPKPALMPELRVRK